MASASESDSEDDVPLAQKQTAATKKAKGEKTAEVAVKTAQVESVSVNGTQAKAVHKTTEKASTSTAAKPSTSKAETTTESLTKTTKVSKATPKTQTSKQQSNKAANGDSKVIEKKVAKETKATVTKVKVEYDLPGQTKPTPDSGESLTKFYTSLLRQNPDSEIANKWCIQHGLCSKEKAVEWLTKQGKLTSPVKRKAVKTEDGGTQRAKAAAKPARKSNGSTKAGARPKTVKRERLQFESDDDDSEAEALPVSKRKKVKEDSEDEALPVSKRKKAKEDMKPAPSNKPAPSTPAPSKPAAPSKAAKAANDDDDSSDEDLPLAQKML